LAYGINATGNKAPMSEDDVKFLRAAASSALKALKALKALNALNASSGKLPLCQLN